jgi:hypothetical protein
MICQKKVCIILLDLVKLHITNNRSWPLDKRFGWDFYAQRNRKVQYNTLHNRQMPGIECVTEISSAN